VNRLVISDSNSPGLSSHQVGSLIQPRQHVGLLHKARVDHVVFQHRADRDQLGGALGQPGRQVQQAGLGVDAGEVAVQEGIAGGADGVTRHGRSDLPVAALMVSTWPLNTMVSTRPARSAQTAREGSAQ
jgi:hypothetical protein